MERNAISVRQLNLYAKSLLEGDSKLSDVRVTGEISNFKNHYASGHWYFTLKDSTSSVKCVMFRASAARVKLEIKDGMLVEVRGRVSLYEKDGQYQFYAESITASGEGDIALEFNRIKKRLSQEGLFDPENKRPIPKNPQRIAVITSATGAAVQDILNILARRNPLCEVLLCPVSVQGQSAVPEMLDALNRVYALCGIDIIIIGRGGGSAEDLWAFNSEELARKIYESPIPVISAVGHETDFTMADFTADLRAPTPSAAAELAVQDMSEILSQILKYRTVLSKSLANKYNLEKARLSAVMASSVFKQPQSMFYGYGLTLDRLEEKLRYGLKSTLDKKNSDFEKKITALESLNPLKLMASGYSVTQKDGSTVTSAEKLKQGDIIEIMFSDGKVRGKII